MSKVYINQHKHTHYSNTRSLDCVVKPNQYIERMKELGHNVYVCMEHGSTGNIYEADELCKKHGLKLVVGVEGYFVKDIKEKDRSNRHLCIYAKNENGRKHLNRIISKSNTEGYYYRPRIDDETLFSLPCDDVMITTACTAGILSLEDSKYNIQLIKRMKDYFKDNLYLEVQAHTHKMQVDHNKKVLRVAEKLDIPLIHGNDSHYIRPEDSYYRDMFLKGKGIEYPEETGFILDYPSYDEIIERYKTQGILSDKQMKEALMNTLVMDDYGISLDREIKMPKISKNANEEFKQIIKKEWNKEAKNVDKSRLKEYAEAIKFESNIVQKTKMEEYFVLDYKIVKRAKEKYNAIMTRSGRGSGVSFYINKLLGLTEIDRLESPITLYPTRFMSISRIMDTKSLPDIDLNSANREPLIRASKDFLGEDGCHWLLSYKPLQESSAFRLWCKAKGYDISEYNEVAKDIGRYVNDEKWGELIKESEVFIGVIESVSPSPCSFLLLDKPISEEVGLIKVGDEICCNLDGYYCDVYKYLKNDYLQTTVWEIIDETCKLVGIPIPTINELNLLLDEKTYKMYELGLTATLNQIDSDFATELVKKYKPKTVAEVSAFVAGIRPGFASLLNKFLNRKDHTTGVPELDEILHDSYCYLMYQESIMKYLVWLGVEESVTYDIIKKISKKKFKESELEALKKELHDNWIKVVGRPEGFEETWKVVEDAARYSFNASHSLSYAYDSLYCAYLKAHFPLEYYTVILNIYNSKVEKTARILKEMDYFGIKFEDIKFGKSKSSYFMDVKNMTIYKGVKSIKYLNEEVSNDLYDLYQEKHEEFKSFVDVLVAMREIKINSRQLGILIKLGYFREYGKSKKLLEIVEIFNDYYDRKTFNKEKYPVDLLRKYAKTETAKQFKDVDKEGIIKELVLSLKDEDITYRERMRAELEFTGTIVSTDISFDRKYYAVTNVNTKFKTPTISLSRVIDGKTTVVKIKPDYFVENPIEIYDIIRVTSVNKEPKNIMQDGRWVKSKTEKNSFIGYDIIK